MHLFQKKIIDLANKKELSKMTLREIGNSIGVKSNKPQLVKHHLDQLVKKGILKKENKKYYRVEIKNNKNKGLISLPIYGAANCGEATLFANDYIEGYLRLSPSMLKGVNTKSLFALEASGDSMNRATLKDKEGIEDGDFVLVDSSQKNIENNAYIVSVIDGCANIKKVKEMDNQIVLLSESTKNYPPIIIHEDDKDSYSIAGRVVDVIKN